MTRPSSLEPTQLRAPAAAPGSSRQSASAVSPSSTKSVKAVANDSPTPFKWRSWPVVDEARRSWPLIAVLAAVAVLAGWMTSDVFAGLLVAAVLAAAVWRLWLPVTYEINSQGIEERCFGRQKRIPWSQLIAGEIHAHGISFQFELQDRAGCMWRSFFLPWDRHRETVLAALVAMPSAPFSGAIRPASCE
jgi:hypothetical protein